MHVISYLLNFDNHHVVYLKPLSPSINFFFSRVSVFLSKMDEGYRFCRLQRYSKRDTSWSSLSVFCTTRSDDEVKRRMRWEGTLGMRREWYVWVTPTTILLRVSLTQLMRFHQGTWLLKQHFVKSVYTGMCNNSSVIWSSDKAVFKWLAKVIARLWLLHLVIRLKSCTSVLKSIMPWTHDFPHALSKL